MKPRNEKILKSLITVIPALIFILLFWIGFRDLKIMKVMFFRISYFIMGMLALLWLIQVGRFLHHIRFSLWPFIKKYQYGLIIAPALTGIVFVSVPVNLETS